MKVLVADDEFTARSITIGLLKRWGHETVAARDGDEAWRILTADDAPGLAILDWMMPGLEGPEICRRLRASERSGQFYLIILTTRGNPDDIVDGLEAGADDYVIKPFDAGELRARVDVGCRVLALQAALAKRVSELQTALAQVKTLRGLLPICAGCKKIRDDRGYWRQIESYLSAHADVDFSHGLCPECMKKLYPEFVRDQ